MSNNIPKKVAACPYCSAALYVEAIVAWERDSDDEPWLPSQVEIECETAPDITSDEWDDHFASHNQMPYVYWLPVEVKVLDWLQQPEQGLFREQFGIPD